MTGGGSGAGRINNYRKEEVKVEHGESSQRTSPPPSVTHHHSPLTTNTTTTTNHTQDYSNTRYPQASPPGTRTEPYSVGTWNFLWTVSPSQGFIQCCLASRVMRAFSPFEGQVGQC